MIIGNGLIARAFEPIYADDTRYILFASGVSNSQETVVDAFERERKLLIESLAQKKHIIYFGTCSVLDPQLLDSPYVQHKLSMEMLVRGAENHTIFRLPQVVGRTANPHTLTNFFFEKIRSRSPFKVWQYARRHLIDIDDVVRIAHTLLNRHHASESIFNIATPFTITIPELVRIFEDLLDIPAQCEIVDAGASYDIDASLAIAAATQVGITFEQTYVKNLIKKYYV